MWFGSDLPSVNYIQTVAQVESAATYFSTRKGWHFDTYVEGEWEKKPCYIERTSTLNFVIYKPNLKNQDTWGRSVENKLGTAYG